MTLNSVTDITGPKPANTVLILVATAGSALSPG